jgi:hypothetical protein
LYSAVSQNCILRSLGKYWARAGFLASADYKSAIQQIENLRYGFSAQVRRVEIGDGKRRESTRKGE